MKALHFYPAHCSLTKARKRHGPFCHYPRMKYFFLVTLLSSTAFAQAPPRAIDIQKMSDAEIRQHAAETVAHLHDTMLDPASFVLDGAYVTKPNKRGRVSICYAFRSHNTMGGYSEARAVEDGDDKNKLSVMNRDDG